jgi:hypothetical protein
MLDKELSSNWRWCHLIEYISMPGFNWNTSTTDWELQWFITVEFWKYRNKLDWSRHSFTSERDISMLLQIGNI